MSSSLNFWVSGGRGGGESGEGGRELGPGISRAQEGGKLLGLVGSGCQVWPISSRLTALLCLPPTPTPCRCLFLNLKQGFWHEVLPGLAAFPFELAWTRGLLSLLPPGCFPGLDCPPVSISCPILPLPFLPCLLTTPSFILKNTLQCC